MSDPGHAEILNLPVPKVTILPNTVISEGALMERQFRVTSSSIAGFATLRSELLGRQAQRRLGAGKPIPLLALGSPVMVRRGAVAAATYIQDGFMISGSLVALRDGEEGVVIDARNPTTGITVRATVNPDGTLMVSE